MLAILGNAKHPEYGSATVPLPIPNDEYGHVMELLGTLGIGDVMERDCKVEEIRGGLPILKRLEKVAVNIDELDYLAKRLDSFDYIEAAQFQAMAVKTGIFDMKGLINLTFCCQQATVITDFSDLEAIGRHHLVSINGGCLSSELADTDLRMTALKLILSKDGTVTPYGVVYDNGLKLEEVYDGRHLPGYHYEQDMLAVGISSRADPEITSKITSAVHQQTSLQEAAASCGGMFPPLPASLTMEQPGPFVAQAASDGEHPSWNRLPTWLKCSSRAFPLVWSTDPPCRGHPHREL